jgi:hypothetical protein
MALELTVQRVRELINYDPLTGVFKWGQRAGHHAGNRCKPSHLVGHVNKQTGYLTIRADKKLYQAHRLAWLHVYGTWPANDIDHINGNRLDNRIDNLRDVQNNVNRENVNKARSDSSTGIQGVSPYKQNGRFQAQIRANGKMYSLGTFATVEEARAAYIGAKALLHPGWVPQSASDLRHRIEALPKCGVRARCDSTSGVRGVSPHQGKWKARFAGQYVGVFETVAEAESAYLAARQAAH